LFPNFIKRGTHARADFTSVREKSCPLDKSGSPYGFRQRIGEAISKIQFGRVAARFAEVAIGLTRYASLRFGDRLNRDLRFLDQFIKTPAGNRIFAAINHRSGFQITHQPKYADGRAVSRNEP
jgi:hypothetical protein